MDKSTRLYLLSLVLFGSNGILASQVALPSAVIVLFRTIFATAALVAILAARRTKLATPSNPRCAAWLAASGASLGLAWVCLFAAYSRVGVGVSSLLYYCGPVIVMALSPVLFGERLTVAKVAGFAAVLAGAFLTVGAGSGSAVDPLGILLGLGAACGYAGVVVFRKFAGNAIEGVEATAVQVAAACVASLAGALGTGALAAPIDYTSVNWLPLVILGVANTGLGYILYSDAMGALPVQRTAVLGYLEPLSAVLLSVVLLGEPLTAGLVLGACLIVGGAASCELVGKGRGASTGSGSGSDTGATTGTGFPTGASLA